MSAQKLTTTNRRAKSEEQRKSLKVSHSIKIEDSVFFSVNLGEKLEPEHNTCSHATKPM